MVKQLIDQIKEHKQSNLLMLLLTITSALVFELLFCQLGNNVAFSTSLLRVCLSFISLLIVQHYATKAMLRFTPTDKDYLLFHGLLVASSIIFWLGKILSLALVIYLQTNFTLFVEISTQSLDFAIPFAFGGLLLAAIKGLNYGYVFGVCFALLVGIYLPEDPLIIPYVLLTNLIACLSLSDLRNRSTYLRAALKIAMIALPFALVSLVYMHDFTFAELLLRVITPILSGLLAVAIAGAATPLLEQVGGYVTDLRLIEMSTLDHPLLKDLSIQAPGTWNHSMVIGMMVEAAADEVGANKVLSRVGAYFHDVGKVKKPAYFIENQQGGENKHDKLSPSMSALIIRSHVKDGAEMAKEHRLPQPIIDLILQHHGTSLIEYFYNKACNEAEDTEDAVEVDKSLYTYPGPKPQTREAGLLMLADVIESSSRTLSDHSFDRIQLHVQKMINKIFASAQLEESDLTLRDLHKIAKTFTRVLSGIHHQRIKYEQEPSDRRSQAISQKDNNSSSEAQASSNSTRTPKSTQKKKRTEATKNKSSKVNGQKGSTERTDSDRGPRETSPAKEENQAKKAQEAEDKNLKRLGVE